MLTVTLKPDVARQVEELTRSGQADAETLVDQALRAYLAQRRQEEIRAEMEAFDRQRAALLARHKGQYVAMYGGQVVDHDPNLRALHLRVFERFGHAPVLLRQVLEEPEREIVFRSPRVEQP